MVKKKRPYFVTAKRVLDAFDRNRKMSSAELGELLDLHPAYIRKVLQRNDRKLANSKPK